MLTLTSPPQMPGMPSPQTTPSPSLRHARNDCRRRTATIPAAATSKSHQSSSSSSNEHRSSEGVEILNRLRNEPFNKRTEQRLESQPYLLAAESGTLTLAQRRAFAREQFAVQRSDAASFASLAGHNAVEFASRTGSSPLAEAKVPDPIRRPAADGDKDEPPDLFHFLLGGEILAAPLLVDHARSVGIPDEASCRGSGSTYEPSPMAQAYPSYWARLALSGNRVAGAAACAVNFPAWGRMCRRLAAALSDPDHGYGYEGPNDVGLAFVNLFASPIEGLDDMAVRIIDAEAGVDGGVEYDDLAEPVRLLQAYEVMFWDAVYAAKLPSDAP